MRHIRNEKDRRLIKLHTIPFQRSSLQHLEDANENSSGKRCHANNGGIGGILLVVAGVRAVEGVPVLGTVSLVVLALALVLGALGVKGLEAVVAELGNVLGRGDSSGTIDAVELRKLDTRRQVRNPVT